MFSSISNRLSATFSRSPKTPTKTPPSYCPPSVSLAKWPDDVCVPEKPLFTRHLTTEDLDALQESCGLGPAGYWWLDAELAASDPIKGSELTYEDEVALTAFLRAPFEQAGPIRSAAEGLLDRLNELERLQKLAEEENLRKALGREKRVRHHSTLRLASNVEPEDGDVPIEGEFVTTPGGGLIRRETYAVRRRKQPVTSSPVKAALPQDPNNPRFCKSPERTQSHRPEETTLQRTYSKNSLNHLAVPGKELKRSLNGGLAHSDLSDNSTQLLGRTYDADEQLSDVFPSPHVSLERLNAAAASQPPPPPTPSSELPQGTATRHMTYNRPSGNAQSRLLARGDTLVPRSSASPLRSKTSSHPLPPSGSTEGAQVLKTSGSGSNLLPNSFSDTLAMAREQESKLRASSGRGGEVNVSLTSSIEGGSGGGGSTNQLNRSFPLGEGHIFAQREVGSVPQRYDPDGKRTANGELARHKSSSQSSLKDMASLNEMLKAQAESLRASGEQVLQKVRSRNSLGQSVEGRSSISSRESSPFAPPVANRSIERPTDLRGSGATYDLQGVQASVNSSIRSDEIAPPIRSNSPIRMRRGPRESRTNIPPPLALPIDTEQLTPDTPRPSSYVEQLHSAEHGSSVTEAWVADTMTTMNASAHMGVNLAASSDSLDGLRVSTDTYPLGEPVTTEPSGMREPSPQRDNVMTASQRTVVETKPPATQPARRAIAPSSIRGGVRRGATSVRPPSIPRPSRPPALTTAAAAKARPGLPTGTGIPRGTVSGLRPPTRIRAPTTVPRGRLPARPSSSSRPPFQH